MKALLSILAAGAVSLLAAVASASAQGAAGAPVATNVRIHATPPGAPVGAAYLQIAAGAKGADKLLEVKIDAGIAGVVEIHDTISEKGVMKMRRVEGIEVKPGAPVKLEPGGKHIMLMNLKRQLKAGESVPLVLVFEKAGEVPVVAKVEPMGGGHGSHKGH